jgi:L-asparaginase/Glu-tRNA(Gln) amidotransferase subunit D
MTLDRPGMTGVDHELILKTCSDASDSRAVTMHDTDTLSETARFLGKRVVQIWK